MTENLSVSLLGTVEKVIKSPVSGEPEKAQITVEGADRLCTEIRIENALTDEMGEKVSMKAGAKVQVTVRSKTGQALPRVVKEV